MPAKRPVRSHHGDEIKLTPAFPRAMRKTDVNG
jgi:hypothetical protein